MQEENAPRKAVGISCPVAQAPSDTGDKRKQKVVMGKALVRKKWDLN